MQPSWDRPLSRPLTSPPSRKFSLEFFELDAAKMPRCFELRALAAAFDRGLVQRHRVFTRADEKGALLLRHSSSGRR
jgi:hypothetical protein